MGLLKQLKQDQAQITEQVTVFTGTATQAVSDATKIVKRLAIGVSVAVGIILIGIIAILFSVV